MVFVVMLPSIYPQLTIVFIFTHSLSHYHLHPYLTVPLTPTPPHTLTLITLVLQHTVNGFRWYVAFRIPSTDCCFHIYTFTFSWSSPSLPYLSPSPHPYLIISPTTYCQWFSSLCCLPYTLNWLLFSYLHIHFLIITSILTLPYPLPLPLLIPLPLSH